MTLTEETTRTRYLAGQIAEKYADVLEAAKKPAKPGKGPGGDVTPECPPPQTRGASCKGPKKKASGWSAPPMQG